MRILQVGLGSMGKRRIRCAKRLGLEGITGFDFREDRRIEASSKYGIRIAPSLADSEWESADAIVVSTPPDKHLPYIMKAINHRKPVFVEASVILDGLADADRKARAKKTLVAPSCTLRYHPAIKEIKRLVRSGGWGKVTSFSYHMGQYLPDWHPWEPVKSFYVSKKETGACREIVPFELTWLTDILGFPKTVKGLYGRTMDVQAPIDDTYAVSLEFSECFGTLVVDVVSRYATRSLILNLEKAQILWRWDEPVVKVYDAINKRWIIYNQPQSESQEGYNKNISEAMYVEELGAFLAAAKGKGRFPNTLQDDMRVLRILQAAEKRR